MRNREQKEERVKKKDEKRQRKKRKKEDIKEWLKGEKVQPIGRKNDWPNSFNLFLKPSNL
jgi:hypothetical protein